MGFLTLFMLATAFTSVSAALYPRQSDTPCSYDCPAVTGYVIVTSAPIGDIRLCVYEDVNIPGLTSSICTYSLIDGLLDTTRSIEITLTCPASATCVPSSRRRSLYALPVAPPRASPPQSIPASLKKRGEICRQKPSSTR